MNGYERSARLYDLFDRKENVEFFYHYAAEASEILDVGAGTGRIAIPLARRGATVWRVEPSLAMRREFRGKLERDPGLRERITLAGGDAASFDLDRTFTAAFLSGSFDHLLNDEERLSALENIHRHLSPGSVVGRLRFHTVSARRALAHRGGNSHRLLSMIAPPLNPT